MGSYIEYQPLTLWDKVSVVVYRLGILGTAVVLSVGAYLIGWGGEGLPIDSLLFAIYITAGLSVFSIHLYMRRLKRNLIGLYIVALSALLVIYLMGGINKPIVLLLLLPISGCIGFIGAKEAFCFKLIEGYVIALSLPLYIVIVSLGNLSKKDASLGLSVIAILYIIFTFRKVFQPLHYDIGDKSAYR